MRAGVTLKPGETTGAGTGDAEADIIAYAKANNLKVIDIGATRPVCAPCQDANQSDRSKHLDAAKETTAVIELVKGHNHDPA